MRKHLAIPIAVAAMILMALGAQAQPMGGPHGFGGPPPPGMMAAMKAWQSWNKAHKNVAGVQQMLRGIEAMEQDPHTWLSKPQARAVLDILNHWKNRPVMTDSQAADVLKQTDPLWTAAQKKKIADAGRRRGRGGFGGRHGGRRGGPPPPGMGGPPPHGMGGPPPHGMPGGPPPPGMGGPGHGGPGMGGFGHMTMPKPHDYNPLNPATSPFAMMRDTEQQHLAGLVDTLKRTLKH